MVKYLSFILIVFLMGDIDGCKSDDECEETKSPEINFKFLVGGIINISEDGTGKDLTNDFEDFNIMMNKVYCDGNTSGPFEVPYLISTDGLLVKQSLGTWSFRMDNTEDYMNVNFFCEGHDLGTHNVYYDNLKKDNGGSAYFEYTIHTQWSDTEKFKNTVITVK
jgi:hypothetical protein